MIRFLNVSKAYLGSTKMAIQGISFHLPVGQMAYLTGHSGAGKSTLLKLIMGIEKANGGQIFFNGHNITRLKKADIPFLRRQIGMVHQDFNLLPARSIFDNVALPLIINGTHPNEIKRRVNTVLDRVGLLNRAHHVPTYLSGGEQKRVDIARAIVNRPQLLLADEPTGNLDKALSLQIFNLFDELNHYGMTVLIATHDHSIVTQKPRPTLVLNNGHLDSFQ